MATKGTSRTTDQNNTSDIRENRPMIKHHSGGKIKELGSLEFNNPGPKFLQEFTLEKGLRKNKRKTYNTKYKKNCLYDNVGCLLGDGRDLCDCLDSDCPGCHFPCIKCSSEKCGSECRNKRCFFYDFVTVEGKSKSIQFPQPYPSVTT